MKKVLIITLVSFIFCKLSFAIDTTAITTYNIGIEFIKENTYMNIVESIIFYLKEILTILGLSIGLILGLPFLSRKLREQQFSKIINDIYSANRAVKTEILPLMDEAITKTYTNDIIEKGELNEILDKIQRIQKEAVNSSSQVISFLFLTKKLFQILESDYEIKSTIPVTSGEVYGLLISILNEIDFFASNVVNIKAFGFRKLVYAKDELRTYTTENKFTVFKAPPQGLFISSNSIITIKFIQEVLRTQNYLICRSAFKILGNSDPIARLLLLGKIYFPVRLKEITENEKPFGPFILHLVSFKIMKRWYSSGEPTRNIVSLTYSNIGNFFRYTKTITTEELKENYIDEYLKTSWSDFAEFKDIKHNEPECITFEIEEQVLHSFFEKYSSQLKSKMKSELKRKNK